MDSSPWPYFVPDRYETLAKDFKKLSRAEFVAIQNYVTHDQRQSYVNFITERYQDFTKQGHMIDYGNLDNLDQNTSIYTPDILQKLDGKFVPEDVHDYYFCRIMQSPPARKYLLVNNNLLANGIISDYFMLL